MLPVVAAGQRFIDVQQAQAEIRRRLRVTPNADEARFERKPFGANRGSYRPVKL